MRISLLKKRWNLVFKSLHRHRNQDGEQVVGFCDPPTQPNKCIWIDSNIKDQELLRVLLHEMMHAVDWGLSEEFVDDQSTDIAQVLWNLGYRRITDG